MLGETLAEEKKSSSENAEPKPVKLPCGCVYLDTGWMLTRVSECNYHKRQRTAKRQYKPKAECVRP